MKQIVILYHKNCLDGFGGAWAAWKKFGDKADYFPVEYQTPPPRGLKNKEIYIIDFCYSSQIVEKLAGENRSLTVIDHHIGAEAATKSAPRYVYALNHSGAVLAWKFFHPKKNVPAPLLYIEDHDLWRFNLPDSKAIGVRLRLLPENFALWNKIAGIFQNQKEKKLFTEEGKLLLQYENKIIDELIKEAYKVKFAGYKTLAVNSPIFRSEIGHKLMMKSPPLGIVWYEKNGDHYYVSLRANKKVDASKIAKKFGGGGHKTAAGFNFPKAKKLPWRIMKNE